MQVFVRLLLLFSFLGICWRLSFVISLSLRHHGIVSIIRSPHLFPSPFYWKSSSSYSGICQLWFQALSKGLCVGLISFAEYHCNSCALSPLSLALEKLFWSIKDIWGSLCSCHGIEPVTSSQKQFPSRRIRNLSNSIVYSAFVFRKCMRAILQVLGQSLGRAIFWQLATLRCWRTDVLWCSLQVPLTCRTHAYHMRQICMSSANM